MSALQNEIKEVQVTGSVPNRRGWPANFIQIGVVKKGG